MVVIGVVARLQRTRLTMELEKRLHELQGKTTNRINLQNKEKAVNITQNTPV